MIVNKLKADQALGACQLIGKVPYTTFCYRVRVARKQGRYKKEAKRISIDVIEVDEDARSDSLLSPVANTAFYRQRNNDNNNNKV